MFEKVKLTLRLRGNAFDEEVKGLIAAAKADLRLAGIVSDDLQKDGGSVPPGEATVEDPLIERAIILYCKAHFGFNPDAKRFEEAYEYQKRALVLAGDYHAVE